MLRPRLLRRPKTLAGKAGGGIGATLALLVIVFCTALWHTSQRLADAWTLSEEFGFANTIEAICPPVASERNMAVPLEQAAKQAAEFMACELCKVGEGECSSFLEGPAFPASTDALREDAAYEQALAEADARPEYSSAHAPPFEVGDVVWQRAKFLRVEQAIVVRLVGQERYETAARRLLRTARLVRRLETGEPCLVGFQLNHAPHLQIVEQLNLVLRRAPKLPRELHDEIENEFARCEDVLKLLPRVGHVEKLNYVRDYAKSPLGGNFLLQPFALNEQAYALGVIHAWMKTADKPYRGAAPVLNSLVADLKEKRAAAFGSWFYPTTDALVAQIEQVRKPFDRLIAMARCLRVVNAWARVGVYGGELEGLGLPPGCLVDPHDGERLRVRRTPAGPVVYSVGPDLKDDGGTFIPPVDLGLGPPAGSGAK